MGYRKGVAFKVNAQPPRTANPPPQAFGSIINCRIPKGGPKEDVPDQPVPLPGVGESPSSQRKRRKLSDGDNPQHLQHVPPTCTHTHAVIHIQSEPHEQAIVPVREKRIFPVLNPRPTPKPPKVGVLRGKARTAMDDDVWMHILEHMNPAQLFAVYSNIVPIYRVMSRYKSIWQTNRELHYGDAVPAPPSMLTEYQLADLMHGRGCMNPTCETDTMTARRIPVKRTSAQNTRQSTPAHMTSVLEVPLSAQEIEAKITPVPRTPIRKTYWPWLRRWCKACFEKKTIAEDKAVEYLRQFGIDVWWRDTDQLRKCLVAGQLDSWRNYLGTAPAHAYAYLYLRSDVEKLKDRYLNDFLPNGRPGPSRFNLADDEWINARYNEVQEIMEFARKMDVWDKSGRQSQSQDYDSRKDARKRFFIEEAAKLTPPITEEELVKLKSFRQAVRIPKDPHPTSWTHLRPKLEKEVQALRNEEAVEPTGGQRPPSSSASWSTRSPTPTSQVWGVQSPSDQFADRNNLNYGLGMDSQMRNMNGQHFGPPRPADVFFYRSRSP